MLQKYNRWLMSNISDTFNGQSYQNDSVLTIIDNINTLKDKLRLKII